MATSILTEDFVGICLILAEGNLGASLEEVILAAERFQQERNRHFGTWQDDFRLLLHTVIDQSWTRDGNFRNIRFLEVIPRILSFREAYFNDEGAHLFGKDCDIYPDSYENETAYWTGYGREQLQRKLEMKAEMKEYFRGEFLEAKAVREWMRVHGIRKGLLYRCSSPGALS